MSLPGSNRNKGGQQQVVSGSGELIKKTTKGLLLFWTALLYLIVNLSMLSAIWPGSALASLLFVNPGTTWVVGTLVFVFVVMYINNIDVKDK